jgi:hypothetical protein
MIENENEEIGRDGASGKWLQGMKAPENEAAFDPDEAERIAFREDALSDQDARESASDL